MNKNKKKSVKPDVDAIVVGAGFAGMYMLHSLRENGFSVQVFEKESDVGGTWYSNRYPGARCDSDSIYYNYTFSEELFKGWTWSSRYPEQKEILSYLNYVADELDIRDGIQFNTTVISAQYHEDTNLWNIFTDDGASLTATYFITAVGCLAAATNVPDFKGLNSFTGEWYHTGNWPHEQVDFTGKKVGVIGTGSSGVQSIPVIAKEAEHLTVFQRTAQYSFPARNHPYDEQYIKNTKDNYHELKKELRESHSGQIIKSRKASALEDTPEDRIKAYEERWDEGGYLFIYDDLLINEQSNVTAAEFIRDKIASIVHDKETAQKLMPTYYWGTKRQILDTDYYETFNRDNVSLIDVKKNPIEKITPKGIKTSAEEVELDIIVFATGFDGMTGPLFRMDIRGKNSVPLKSKWKDGAETRTYLGLSTNGFPNMFMITGPESPSVLSNMPISIEQHVEWIADCIHYMQTHHIESMEANSDAEVEWSEHCKDLAEATLYTKTDSWYMGANIEGKARRFPIYVGGVGNYRNKCTEVAKQGYTGFDITYSS